MLRNPNRVLFILIVLALVLRLGGISRGFPFIFDPDEPAIVNSTLALRFNPNLGSSFVKVIDISDTLKIGPPISVYRSL